MDEITVMNLLLAGVSLYAEHDAYVAVFSERGVKCL